MENTTKIKQYIRGMAPQPYTEVHLAQVKSVEGDTCTILLDGLEIDGVSLRPVQDNATHPLRITPAPGAYAIVADLSEGHLRRLAVLAVSEAEKIELRGGDNGGLVNIESLKNYLYAFKTAVSQALQTLATLPTPPQGTLLAPLIKQTFDTAMQQAAQHLQTLEDPTITH